MKRYIWSVFMVIFLLSATGCSLIGQIVPEADIVNSGDVLSDQEEIDHSVASESHLVRNIVISALILLFAFALNWVIIRFSGKLEQWLARVDERLHKLPPYPPSQRGVEIVSPSQRGVEIVSPSKMGVVSSYLLRGFLFFYDGLKWILIAFITIESVNFLLGIAQLQNYFDYAPILLGIFQSIAITIIFYYLYRLNKVCLFKIYHKFSDMKPKIMEKIQYKSVSLLTEDRLIELAKHIIKAVYYIVLLILVYFYITLLFSSFTFTQTWATQLFGYILTPIEKAFIAIISYLPKVFTIAVIVFMIKYFLQLIKFIFTAIEREKIVIRGFYKDWAMPTYHIVRFLVIVFGVIVIFPYLPGANSPFFRGISVFIGVLFSIGSSSAIANIVAGIVLTYMRPFKVGERVKIAETMGDVVEKTLLVTRVRTVKNVDITIPNAMVLGSHIINYSSSSADVGLIVHTSVTIGYDAPWTEVHKALLTAADRTALLLKDPKPFVLQTALGDFAVNYELNGYTHSPAKMAAIYSEIHQHIQDTFNEAGIEIMSPTYSAVRDGNQTTIPESYLPPSYQKPAFKVDTITKLFKQ